MSITCSHFAPNSSSAGVCQWFVTEGACAHPFEFGCVELQKSGKPPQLKQDISEQRKVRKKGRNVTLTNMVVHWETEKAMQVSGEDENENDAYWLPKSQIVSTGFDRDKYNRQVGTIEITSWIAKQKGLI